MITTIPDFNNSEEFVANYRGRQVYVSNYINNTVQVISAAARGLVGFDPDARN